MQSDQDQAFLRHAVDAGLLSPPQADLCLARVQAEAKAGRSCSAPMAALELRLLDEAGVRAVLAMLVDTGRAPAPAPASAEALPGAGRWGASVASTAPAAGAPAVAPTPDLTWGAVRSTAKHARAKTTSERVAAPEPPPAPPAPDSLSGTARGRAPSARLPEASSTPPADSLSGTVRGRVPSARLPEASITPPAEKDPSETTAELRAVLPLPAGAPDEDLNVRTLKLQAVLPLPAPPADDLNLRTLKLKAVLPLPEDARPAVAPVDAPLAPAVSPLTAAIADAVARAERSVVVPPAPEQAAPTSSPVVPPPRGREPARSQGRGYFAAAAVALVLMIVVAARSSSTPATASPPPAVPVAGAAPTTEVTPRAFAPRVTAPPAPPPVARPDDLLAAFEAAVARHIEAGHFANALALEAGLAPDVAAAPERRARIDAARRRVEEAHGVAVQQQRAALRELVDQGEVAGARQKAREAAAWAIGGVDLSREVELLVRRRDGELADLAAAPGLDLPRLEAGLRSFLAGFGPGASLLPNGGISLDYGAAHAALAEDLKVRAPPHDLGVRIDAGSLPVMAVHRLPLAQVLDVTVKFVVLARPREDACLALLLVDSSRREPLGYGLTWDCEPVQLARGHGLVRSKTAPGRPATPRVPYRLTVMVPRDGPPALGGTVAEQRENGWRFAVAPAPVPAGVGQVAIYVRGVDVCVTSLQVRGVVDPARVPTR